ncbi:hypothetical protein BH10BAC3_BH10BAC3_00910 [soil metagenome]
MKKIIQIISLLSFSFVITGCPYENTVPIDSPSIKINPKLLGSWQVQNDKNDIYKVTKLNEFTYAITEPNKEKNNYTLLTYESVINGFSFLNMWEDEPGKARQYALYKMDIKPNGSVTLAEVTDNITEHFTSADQLKKFVAANMKNSYFYGKDEIQLIRKGE